MAIYKCGMTSVTFRDKTPEEIIALTKQAKLQGIEWGSDVHVPVGNLELAKEIGDKTRAAGLEVFSYGSYHIIGDEGFASVAETAVALGCKVVRVWGTKIPSASCTEEDYEKAINALLEISDIAAKYGITVAMEFHHNNINDCAKSSLKLLQAVNRDNIKTYWQPLYDVNTNLEHIEALKPYMMNVHVYNWVYTKPITRKMLAENQSDFEQYFPAAGPRNYILEFVKDNSVENFFIEAALLRKMLHKGKSIILSDRLEKANMIYGQKEREILVNQYGCENRIFTSEDLNDEDFTETEYIFSTWGMPSLTEKQIETYFPNLKCVFYSAGTVKYFAQPFLNKGIRIFSAWQANAIPVIECCVAEILLATKGFYYLSRESKKGHDNYLRCKKGTHVFPGNYDAKIGLIGLGAIGKGVIDALKKHDLEFYVYSSKVTKENEEDWGVKAASLSEIFENCDVISNHLANVPATYKIINKELIDKMKPYSTFINTGRGAQVDEDALAKKLSSDSTITAVLDVTDPEPPLDESPFYTLENVVLTPHFAGSSGNEVRRMAQYMIEEAVRYENGETCLYEVTEDMLDKMA